MRLTIKTRLDKLERGATGGERGLIAVVNDGKQEEIDEQVERALASAGIERRAADLVVVVRKLGGHIEPRASIAWG
jgi:hypothetical protein